MIFFKKLSRPVFLACGICSSNNVKQIVPHVVRESRPPTTILRKKTFEDNSKKRADDDKYPSGYWILLTVPITSFVLGTWQIQRKIEKEKMIKELEKATKLDPVEFPENLDDIKNMEYHPVKVRGKFNHSKEIKMGPRTLKKGTENPASLFATSSTNGYWIITPFTLSDRNLTILVNRGWVPTEKKSANTRKAGQITEEVEFVGLIRHNEKREPLGMKNIPEKGVWMYRDLEKMSEVAGTHPILIDADLKSSHPAGPIGGQTLVKLYNKHLSYIITWYGLCIGTSYIWYQKFVKLAVK